MDSTDNKKTYLTPIRMIFNSALSQALHSLQLCFVLLNFSGQKGLMEQNYDFFRFSQEKLGAKIRQ